MKFRQLVGLGMMVVGVGVMVKNLPPVQRAIQEFKDGYYTGVHQARKTAVKEAVKNVAAKPLTHEEIKAVVQKVVSDWMFPITKELGIQHRVLVSIKDTYEPSMNTNGGFALGTPVGMATTNLSVLEDGTHATSCEQVQLFVDGFAQLKFASENTLYARVLWTLAHELRHAYQAIHGLTLTNQKHAIYPLIGHISFELPYSQQWIELDANKWAHWFLNNYAYNRKFQYEEVPSDFEVEDYHGRYEIHCRKFNDLKVVK